MGCSESKLDNLPAVSLCRDRCKFLDHTLRHLHALAKAHVAYTRSLHSSGTALRLFLDRQLACSAAPRTASGIAYSKTPPPSATVVTGSPSTSSSSRSSDSHIKFDSDSDHDENPNRKPAESHQTDYIFEEHFNPDPFDMFIDKFTSVNYMKRHPAPPATCTDQVHDNHYEIDRFFGPTNEPSVPPPPPPPAPTESAWDFMNFFDPYEMPFGSRRREVKEMPVRPMEEVHREGNADAGKRDYEVKKEKVNKEKDRCDDGGKAAREVEILFHKASGSGDEVLNLIKDDVFGARYCQVNGVNPGASYYDASAKAADEATPFIENPGKMRKEKDSVVILGVDGDGDTVGVGSARNLSSTLKKLWVWEKKLLREVKTEEKSRVVYTRKCQELKRLIERGADASKIDSTRAVIGSLSTRLKISLHVIDKISLKISKLSDEELCPLINELIHSLFEMWKVMSECHRGQLRAIAGAKDLDWIKLDFNHDDVAVLEVLLQLKLEIHSLNLNFSNWVNIQAGCAGALNGWMIRCLGNEPEEMLDAPLVSVICSRWARALRRIRETEVFDTTREFYEDLHQAVMESGAQSLYLQSKQVQDKEKDRKMKIFEEEEHRMNRATHQRAKRLNLAAGNYDGALLHGRSAPRKTGTDKKTPVHESLKCIFESMERFALDSMGAYEELLTEYTKG